MKELLLLHYGLEVHQLTPLDGYVSENYQVESTQGNFVLKVYPFQSHLIEDIEGEIALAKHLKSIDSCEISQTLNSQEGRALPVVEHEERTVILRLLTFVEGEFLAQVSHDPKLFHSLGQQLGAINQQLLSFRNWAIESRRLEWNLNHFEKITPLASHIQEASKRKIVDHFILQWRTHVARVIPHLRHSIIHNDANDWNVLVQDKGFGFIDLGDASYTALISELAIASTYVSMAKEKPVQWVCYLLEGYHQTLALEPKELDILYYLIAARLVTSVCKSAEQALAQPDNEYIQISEQGAWDLLEKWIQISPLYAKNAFYQSCGYEVKEAPEANDLVKKRHQFISKGVSISYQQPIHMDTAIFQYMFDRQGNRILDAYNNIPHVGHQHPKVVEAGQRQMSRLNTNTRYLYDSLTRYAEKLLSKFPEPLNKVYFVNSGSAASDLAIRMAQNFTNRQAIGVVEHGYHGNTRLGIDISPYKYDGKGGNGRNAQIIEAPIPDIYRGIHKDRLAGKKYAQEYLKSLEHTAPLAAFIAEPIVGCGGQVPLAKGYLPHLYSAFKKAGTICISDEVQTGFGRMGSHFWGFEMHEVVPDMVILGKPIANGHPMGAVVTTTEIADAFDNGMEFFSSFGGNPVSCEIANAVLEVLESEDLPSNAWEVGQYKKQLFHQLQDLYPVIGDVRGAGLFLGIELIQDELLTPHTKLAARIKNELRRQHILVSTDGPFESVIKSKPPMCFSKNNAEELVEAIADILKG